MITGLPPYVPPQLLQVRCPCGSLYLVYCGEGDDARAREQAEARGARFVEARSEPFILYECGRALDFALDDSEMIQ